MPTSGTGAQPGAVANVRLPLRDSATNIRQLFKLSKRNRPGGLMNDNNRLSNLQLSDGSQPNQVAVTPDQSIKEWRQLLTRDLRNHVTRKLFQEVFPTTDRNAVLDKRMHNFVEYARKVEGDTYTIANSMSQYYYLIAEKIYKIRKEFEKKRQIPKEQHMQTQQQQPSAPGASAAAANIQPQLSGLSEGNQPAGRMNDNNRLSNIPLPGGLQPDQVMATPFQGTKEWHQAVTLNLRNHIVEKLIRAIFPTPAPSTMLAKNMDDLIAYAKKVEFEFFKMADSKTEYYKVIAEKLYKIGKEIEGKKQKLKEQQLQARQQQPSASGAPAAAVNIQQQLLGPNEGNQPGGLMNDNNRSSNIPLPDGSQPGQVMAIPVQGTKEWHQSVIPDLRNHVVEKFIRAIFPTPIPSAMLDKNMDNLIAYVKKVELDYFKMADSLTQYYNLIAQKIYKISKEIEGEKQKLNEQQWQAQQQQPSASGAPAAAANIQHQLFGPSEGNEAAGLMNDNNRLSNLQSPGGLQLDQVTPTPVQSTKEWHQSVTPQMRIHFIHKLAQEMFLAFDPHAMLGVSMHNLVIDARKIEGGFYEMATSRSEYYQLIAVKIYGIQYFTLQENTRQE